ncbi:unnamed protein product [Amoebophrya sp. A120]|nr:unnamed protein product [Amoebophrya sp. A120]|eukprot:GSA120T00017369001.1
MDAVIPSGAQVRVGYMGCPGSATEDAILELFEDAVVPESAPAGYADLFEKLLRGSGRTGSIDYALIPIASTRGGAHKNCEAVVRVHCDKLVLIPVSLVLPVQHHLLVHPDFFKEGNTSAKELRIIRSHAHALEHCRDFLESLSGEGAEDVGAKRAKPVLQEATWTTAAAAMRISEEHDATAGAIAGTRAAEIYGLKVLQHDCHKAHSARAEENVVGEASCAEKGFGKENAVRFLLVKKKGKKKLGKDEILLTSRLIQEMASAALASQKCSSGFPAHQSAEGKQILKAELELCAQAKLLGPTSHEQPGASGDEDQDAQMEDSSIPRLTSNVSGKLSRNGSAIGSVVGDTNVDPAVQVVCDLIIERLRIVKLIARCKFVQSKITNKATTVVTTKSCYVPEVEVANLSKIEVLAQEINLVPAAYMVVQQVQMDAAKLLQEFLFERWQRGEDLADKALLADGDVEADQQLPVHRAKLQGLDAELCGKIARAVPVLLCTSADAIARVLDQGVAEVCGVRSDEYEVATDDSKGKIEADAVLRYDRMLAQALHALAAQQHIFSQQPGLVLGAVLGGAAGSAGGCTTVPKPLLSCTTGTTASSSNNTINLLAGVDKSDVETLSHKRGRSDKAEELQAASKKTRVEDGQPVVPAGEKKKRVAASSTLPSPLEMCNLIRVSADVKQNVIEAARTQCRAILHDVNDPRLVVIVGPCSIHDLQVAHEYAQFLSQQQLKYQNELLLIMRVYFEKPRSTVGWKGFLNDPDLDNSCDIAKGLRQSRQLLADIASKYKLPCATEFLDPTVAPYLCDLISWGAIGARTTESQIHREMVSNLPCPMGFKNGTSGDVQVAVDAVVAGRKDYQLVGLSAISQLQTEKFLSQQQPLSHSRTGNNNNNTTSGSTSEDDSCNSPTKYSIIRTPGNPDAHVVLRGGKATGPNYEKKFVEEVITLSKKASDLLPKKVVIDASHGNSNKNYKNQSKVLKNICEQLAESASAGCTSSADEQKNSTPAYQILGVMIESNLVAGNQKVNACPFEYGKSVTDECVDLEETKTMLHDLAEAVRKVQQNKK